MRIDSYDIKQKILSISYVDWKKLGFSKGTLHYMKQNAKSDQLFTLNSLERVKAGKLKSIVDELNSFVELNAVRQACSHALDGNCEAMKEHLGAHLNILKGFKKGMELSI